MVASGLVLWFENWACATCPKWTSDVATSVHCYEAILATLAILVWHLYMVMFDPDVYPMDRALAHRPDVRGPRRRTHGPTTIASSRTGGRAAGRRRQRRDAAQGRRRGGRRPTSRTETGRLTSGSRESWASKLHRRAVGRSRTMAEVARHPNGSQTQDLHVPNLPHLGWGSSRNGSLFGQGVRSASPVLPSSRAKRASGRPRISSSRRPRSA